MQNPVVQVVSELGGEVVYTIRIQGTRFSPPVFDAGPYTVRVGEPGTRDLKTFLGLEPGPQSGMELEVRFGENSR